MNARAPAVLKDVTRATQQAHLEHMPYKEAA